MAALLEEALAHHQAGRAEVAEAGYAAVLAVDPAEPTALYLSGLLHLAAGRTGTAKQRLAALAVVRPHHPSARMALADLHALAGETADAIAGYRAVLAAAPDHAGAALALAEALIASDRAAEAVPLAREAAAMQGNGANGNRASAVLARALLGTGQPDAALVAATAIGGTSAEGWRLRGLCLRQLGRADEARDALMLAVARAPTGVAGLLALGNAHAELEEFEAAIAAFGRAIALDPGSAEARAGRGSVLLLSGNIAAAEASLRHALTLDPDLVSAHQNLAAILTAARRHDEAATHRRAAYRRQSLFVEPGPAGAPRVLLLATAGGGNVPTQFLLPRGRATRITWIIDHAAPDAAPPAHDLVFNTVGDADHAGDGEAAVAALHAAATCPFLNPPARIRATRRDRLPALLAGIDGVVVPSVRRLPVGTVLAEAGLRLPVLLRPAGSHGGREVRRVDTPDGLARMWIAGPEPCDAADFFDTRGADGLYRKYRVIFVDRVPYSYHLAISASWLVHYETADMLADPARCREEARFLADPAAVLGPGAMAALTAIGHRLDLDFAGIDFSLLPDGRILVFEANATMLVHPEPEDGPLAHKNVQVRAVLAAFDRLIGERLSPRD